MLGILVLYVCVCMCVCVRVCVCLAYSLGLYGLEPAMLHFPWNFPGSNTGAGCLFLLQGIFLAQGSNLCLLCLLHYRPILDR